MGEVDNLCGCIYLCSLKLISYQRRGLVYTCLKLLNNLLIEVRPELRQQYALSLLSKDELVGKKVFVFHQLDGVQGREGVVLDEGSPNTIIIQVLNDVEKVSYPMKTIFRRIWLIK